MRRTSISFATAPPLAHELFEKHLADLQACWNLPFQQRLDVLSALNKMNINSATLYPGLDGFCQSLYDNVQIQEQKGWPGMSLTTDRESWVKGI